jgi:hypothetical protein
MDEMRNAYNILAGKLEGKRPLGIPRYRWEDNIRTDLSAMASSCEHCNEISGCIRGEEFLVYLNDC